MDDIVDVKKVQIVNKKFKLFRISKNNISNLIQKKGVPFVGVGIDIGEVIGQAYKVSDTISNEQFISPLILFCESNMQADTMFNNIKKDKTRFTKLAGEIGKTKIVNRNKLTQLFNETTTVEIPSQTMESTNSMEKAKRLSLNNGIFKSTEN